MEKENECKDKGLESTNWINVKHNDVRDSFNFERERSGATYVWDKRWNGNIGDRMKEVKIRKEFRKRRKL
jgi:hypothetical protein